MVVVISGPSGVGKTTIVTRVCELTPYKRSVSYTTRAPRADEQDGIDYNFVSNDMFDSMIRSGKFLEHATVSGNQYGTPHPPSSDTILTIDPQGMEQVRKLYGQALTIFISPPSKEELMRRLTARGKDSAETVAKRMAEFEQFILASRSYDHTVVNNDLGDAVARIVKILSKQAPKTYKGMCKQS